MGELHQKPTKEELRRKIAQSQKELDKLEQDPPSTSPSASPSEPIPSESPSASPSEAPSGSFSASPSEPAPSGSPSPSPSPAPDDEEERKRKREAASSREAHILRSRTKKYDAAVDEAEKITEPNDEDMKKEFGDDWEDMTSGEKRLAKQTWVSNKRFEIMANAAKEGREVTVWIEKVDQFLADPKSLIKYPELEGKQEDFKMFSIKESRRGLDFEDLVLAFNGDLAKNPKPKNKGKMFEKGSPGRKDEKPKPNDGKLSPEAARNLRKTDFKKWKQMLKDGKIRKE